MQKQEQPRNAITLRIQSGACLFANSMSIIFKLRSIDHTYIHLSKINNRELKRKTKPGCEAKERSVCSEVVVKKDGGKE